jgi:hypothetical protein
MSFSVDFNEQPEPDLVLLSASDAKVAQSGEEVRLTQGLEVWVVMDDTDELGRPDPLIATGAVEANHADGGART